MSHLKFSEDRTPEQTEDVIIILLGFITKNQANVWTEIVGFFEKIIFFLRKIE